MDDLGNNKTDIDAERVAAKIANALGQLASSEQRVLALDMSKRYFCFYCGQKREIPDATCMCWFDK